MTERIHHFSDMAGGAQQLDASHPSVQRSQSASQQPQTPQPTRPPFRIWDEPSSACGVGFVVSRHGKADRETLNHTLRALKAVEHRGACAADRISGDGAGIMTDIPFDLLEREPGQVAVAMMFLPKDLDKRYYIRSLIENTFGFLGMRISSYRTVPVNEEVLGPIAKASMPHIEQAIIERPRFCRTRQSFDQLLYRAKQLLRSKAWGEGLKGHYFFCSLSTQTIVYKALTRADELSELYLDLQHPDYRTRFGLFHRRFSTNTSSTWDKAQPFRAVGHNGEINTIAGNRSWSFSREMSLGLPEGELITHRDISDSGSLNEMVEALKFRSSITKMGEILAIMIPPARGSNSFYKFWSRAMEPWDGPALVAFSDGETVGARLDRNGFRPCRWAMTKDYFFLASEAGPYLLDETEIEAKGSLAAGGSVSIDLPTGEVDFDDPGDSTEYRNVAFDPRLVKLREVETAIEPLHLDKMSLFRYTHDDLDKILYPMILNGKEPISSIGDTARPAMFSDQPRSFFDYFYQNFAQVTNPPLDYLRERNVTDLTTYLGKRPNIFAPKELIPPMEGIELSSPILSLSQMAWFDKIQRDEEEEAEAYHQIDTIFERASGAEGMIRRLDEIEQEAILAAKNGATILILTDRHTDYTRPPIPSLLALRTVVNALNKRGLRLAASVLVHSGEVRNTHHVAALVGFGAAAICPYLALEIARYENNPKLNRLDPKTKERQLIMALENGLLKIMAKMGISVVRSYQSSKLFTPLGLSKELVTEFFPGLASPLGGLDLSHIAHDILVQTEGLPRDGAPAKLPRTYQFKEHNKGLVGEKHSMTNTRSKIVHELVREKGLNLGDMALYQEYLKLGHRDEPVNLRHLLELRQAEEPLAKDEVADASHILKTFGSGAMSFGAISAESQRDIFIAMERIGGRSNSGEGGENPYYESDGVSATTKQIASGRFGVTARYLAGAKEYQIKIAQGAKPGEGGQLMGVKVTVDIAHARHTNPGVDLISPPPLHDIYSIEDLKELIYQLKQFNPQAKVGVKLVSGAHVGTIAVGVAKAGADIIHISGGDGGTGAAPISSMKQAGLPWELGLVEAHRALAENNLRDHVVLRTDGGLSTGRDIVLAALLGAQEFDFGKLLLVAEGCVMARICEKNTCPTGIATHNPKFKKKYKGTADHVVTMLTYIAEHARELLASLGFKSLQEAVGRTDKLAIDPRHQDLIQARGFDLDYFLRDPLPVREPGENLFFDGVNPLNARIVTESWDEGRDLQETHLTYNIQNTDRGVLATLAGSMARKSHELHMAGTSKGVVHHERSRPYRDKFMVFRGSAGQGFGAFMVEGLNVTLWGEANDAVCKSMSGGRMVIRPSARTAFPPEQNAIIGNCALYGATGGTLYIHGRAGDRFAVRNSGALAVAEGAGLHACEYMTSGVVILLGPTGNNVGAGMTGGTLFLYGQQNREINREYLTEAALDSNDEALLRQSLSGYHTETQSTVASDILKHWETHRYRFTKYLPVGMVEAREFPRAVEG
ncbi:Glutamate synthase large subunit [Sulfidibacter corallicola]|uniref:Glutamate synthase large subunit n=1 Tax=Sulfidibacter corallicola TaxID=2818388 RepID=A0A8A4TS36_SULCO|nr:glutamate synthase large subunit [Sulfidibacter corallicola]QTD52789.1 glutamate synthase large subunit [Sulfidibacter corallicola]